MCKADMYQKDIFSINYKKLKEMDINVLVFDLDNTIIEKKKNVVDDNVKELFKRLKKDFKVIIISNTWNRKKIEYVSKELDIEYIMNARKPFKYGYNKAKGLSNTSVRNICMIGDQLLTDILGAKKMGYYCCLVDPIHQSELILTKFNRLIEYFIFKRLNKKYNIRRGSYYD